MVLISFSISIITILSENNIEIQSQYNQKIIYKNEKIIPLGFSGPGEIELYTIIGNRLIKKNVQEFRYFDLNIKLNSSNIYILRVKNNGSYRIFKFTVP